MARLEIAAINNLFMGARLAVIYTMSIGIYIIYFIASFMSVFMKKGRIKRHEKNSKAQK